MQHQFEHWLFTNRPLWQNHLFTVVATLLTAVPLLTISAMARPFPLGLMLLVPIVISAFIGGFWSGLLSTVICVAIAPPLLALTTIDVVSGPLPKPTWLIPFLLFGIFTSLLLEALHRIGRRSAASQRLYYSTLANISDAIITTDPQGRIEYMNRAAVELLKRSLAEVIGQPFDAVVDIRDAAGGDKTHSLAAHAYAAGTTVHTGARQILHRPDGTQLPVEASAAPVRNAEDEVINVALTIHDCSQQRQIERALQERLELQERFEYIAKAAPGAVHEMRIFPDGRHQLTYASPSFKEIFGIDPESLRDDASAFVAMIHEEDDPKPKAVSGLDAQEMKPVALEVRMKTAHRGLRWVALSAVPSPEADGSTLWHGVFMDVTDRKRAEERLRASQLQLHAALEAGDMGVLMINLTTGVVEMDATGRQLWNLQSVTDPVLTLAHLLAAVHPDNRAAAQEDCRQMAKGAQLHGGEYRIALADGIDRWLLCRGRVYADETTGHMIKVGVIIDTTQQHRRDEQRLHSQKLEALGVLAGGIAHDFNNLLLAISGNARLLLDELAATDPIRTGVQEIDKAAARAAELVRRILSFSSIHDSPQTQYATALRPVLDEVLGLARAVLPAMVSIQSRIPEDLPAVTADSNQVHQALINLLTNAADAASVADGLIRLNVEVVKIITPIHEAPELQPGSYVRIDVADEGNGIDHELQQRIFDPFFTTKPVGKGTGLGLATVHGIMKGVDGAVTVVSAPGRGATFSLYFPVQDSIPVVAEQRATLQPGTRAAHILYVDDEESLVFLMTRTLQRMGQKVTACAEPEQALAIFKASPDDFDLVVSDMAMPGMSGLELALQMLAIRPHLPFVITSGYVDAAAMARAQQIGVRQMIMKPNTVDELSELLNAILQEEGAVSA